MAARWQLHLGLVNLAVVRHCLLDVLLQCSVLTGEPVMGEGATCFATLEQAKRCRRKSHCCSAQPVPTRKLSFQKFAFCFVFHLYGAMGRTQGIENAAQVLG